MNDHDACRAFRARISAQLDGIEADDAATRRHVLACGACEAFERGARSAQSELRALRGTPVRDLWPELAARARPRRFVHRRIALRAAAAIVAAVATWGALALVAARGRGPSTGRDGLERALAALSAASTTPDEFQQRATVPELQLLAELSNRKDERR
jgi:hypothetical protein